MELFKTVTVRIFCGYLFTLHILRFRYNIIKPIEKLSRRHILNYVDASLNMG